MADYTAQDFKDMGLKQGMFELYQNERRQGLDIVPGTLTAQNSWVPLYAIPGSTEWNSLARTAALTGAATVDVGPATTTSTSLPALLGGMPKGAGLVLFGLVAVAVLLAVRR